MNTRLSILFFFFLLCSCKPKIILKTSFFEGENKDVKRLYEYNTKEKLLTKIENGKKTIQKLYLKNTDKKFIRNNLNKIKIKENFCWISNGTLPDYYYKYEIIFDENGNNAECIDKPIKYEIFETYNAIKDTLKTRLK